LIAAAPVLLFLLLPSLIIVPMALSKSQMIQSRRNGSHCIPSPIISATDNGSIRPCCRSR